MGRENVTAAGRAFLVSSGAFVDTCRVDRQTGENTDPATGAVVKVWGTVLYAGPCRVQQSGGSAGQSELGEAAIRILTPELQLPVVGSEGVQVEDRVTILTARNDTALVGRVYSITGTLRKSHATTRKLAMLEVLS